MTNLGKIAGEIRRISEQYWVAEAADVMLDGGEWSGPAAARALDNKLNDLAQRYGFKDYEALRRTMAERSTYRWCWLNLPH
jgi:hypothetical protein